MAEERPFPILSAILEKGLIRSVLTMEPESRRRLIRRLLVDTATWAIGMGAGRLVMGLLRNVLEEAGLR